MDWAAAELCFTSSTWGQRKSLLPPDGKTDEVLQSYDISPAGHHQSDSIQVFNLNPSSSSDIYHFKKKIDMALFRQVVHNTWISIQTCGRETLQDNVHLHYILYVVW